MAGTITHRWDGTVLTITSDSGTSSCDLRGPSGEQGIRGPQGIPGEPGSVFTETGVIDLSGYVSETELEAKGYQTADDVRAMLGGADLDLDGYVTETELANKGYQTATEISNGYVSKTSLTESYPTRTEVAVMIQNAGVEGGGSDIDLSAYVTDMELDSKGYMTENDVNNLINIALGVIEGGSY